VNEITLASTEASPQRDDDIDLRAPLGTMFDHKWLILTGTALFFLVSVIYVLAATPRYQANAMIQVEKTTPNVPGQAPTSQMVDGPLSQAATEIPLLTSRSMIGEAVEKLDLEIQVRPQRFPLIGDTIARRATAGEPGAVASPWFGLDRYGWGGEQLKIAQLDVPEPLLGTSMVLVAGERGRYSLLDGDGGTLLKGQVGQPASSRGITITVKNLAANPGTRFDVMRQSQLAAVTQLMRGVSAVEQGRDSGIIALTYENTDPVLATQILDQISSAYVSQNMDRNSAEAEKSLKFVNEQLPKVRAELDTAQEALNVFQTRAQTIDINLQTKALLDQTVALSTSIQELRVQQPDIARRFTANHPAYQALEQQIGQLQHEKSALLGRMNKLPDIQQGLFRLTRDVEVTNQTYTNLLDQAQKLDIARASALGNVRVIDRPAVNLSDPVWPKKIPVVAGATALGAFLMIAFVFLRQMLNRSVEDPAAIEQLGLPVYASILLSSQERANTLRAPSRRHRFRPNLLALSAPSDLAMEDLRGLRTSLHFARNDARNNLLMVTGPSSGVGKTFVCSNLAVTMAQAGQRVLLIDADMRRGTLHQVLGARPEDGLSELISGKITLEGAIRRVADTPNLSFITRGEIPHNPSELLMRPHFASMLMQLAPHYDLIIIDTPPVLAVTDATVIGHHVGTSLLVIRYGLTRPREIALAKQRLEQNGVEVKGAIVNAVQKRSSGQYGYGYYDHRPATG